MISINTSCGGKIPVDRKINNSLEIILQTVKNAAKFLLNFTENLYNEMKNYIFRQKPKYSLEYTNTWVFV